LRTGHAAARVKQDTAIALEIETGEPVNGISGEVRLETADPFVHDNAGFFVPESRGSLRILVVSEDNTSFPVIAAMTALSPAIKSEIRHADAATATFDDLDSAEIIVLAGVSRPSSSIRALLTTRAFESKVIVFSPAWNEKDGHFTFDIIKYLGGNAVLRQSTRPVFPVLPDTISWLWKGFPRINDRSVSIEGYIAPIPGIALAKLSNSAMLASSVIDNADRSWIICATPITIDKSNNMAETGFYLPFLDRILKYGLSVAGMDKTEWIAGQPMRNPLTGADRDAMVYNAEGKLAARWNNRGLVVFDLPGAYRIQCQGRPSFWITVKCAPEEGNLKYKPPTAPAALIRTTAIIRNNEFRYFIKSLSGNSSANILWILLALLFVAEVLLWDRKKQ
jgi:hypothetical protein